MKVLAILCVALFAGVALAQEVDASLTAPTFVCDSSNSFVCKLKEIGHHVGFHAKKLGGTLSEVGTSILSAALDQGKDLFATATQALLGTVLEHFNKSGLGKRELIDFSKVKEHFSNGVEFLKNIRDSLKTKFESAVNKLTSTLIKTASLKGIEDDADSKIDAVVAQFKEAGKGGFLHMATTIVQKVRDIWAEAMTAIKAKMGAKSEDKRAILDWFNQAKDGFNALTGQLASTFQPHLDALTAGVKGLADQAKEHGSNLLTSAKGHFDALTGKLSGHLDILKGHAATLGDHAQNALGALKDAVTSIVSQTAGNVLGTIGDIVKTGIDASNIASNHVGDAISGAGN